MPGVDYARISADQSTRSAVLAQGRAAGTGIRHQHEENSETAAAFGVAVVKFYEDNGLTAVQPTIARPATGTVLQRVTVLPLPPGRSRRAAFDPTLLRITAVT